MPNTSKTRPNPNRGMSKFSALRLKSRNSLDNNSSPKLEKISKYFQTVSKENLPGNSNDLSDSPYKNCLTEIKASISNDSLSDENDFKTTEPCGKVSKLIQTKTKKEPIKRRKNYRQTKLKLQDFTDTNPDHLQLALALSESSYTAANSSQSNDSTCSTTPQAKMEAFKTALAQFGFQCNRTNKLQAEMKRNNTEVKKLSKKSRYRYVTPVLYIRTDAERQALISTKINEILANTQNNHSNYRLDDVQLFSENLQQIHNKQAKYFRLNSLEFDEMSLETFYAKNLNLTPQKTQLGGLLKDWGDIAGRDRSPSPVRCLSPDLFESDVSKELDLTQNEEIVETVKITEMVKIDLTQEDYVDRNTVHATGSIERSFVRDVEIDVSFIDKRIVPKTAEALTVNKILQNRGEDLRQWDNDKVEDKSFECDLTPKQIDLAQKKESDNYETDSGTVPDDKIIIAEHNFDSCRITGISDSSISTDSAKAPETSFVDPLIDEDIHQDPSDSLNTTRISDKSFGGELAAEQVNLTQEEKSCKSGTNSATNQDDSVIVVEDDLDISGISHSPISTKTAKVPDSSFAGFSTYDIRQNPAIEPRQSHSIINGLAVKQMSFTRKKEPNKDETNSTANQDETIIGDANFDIYHNTTAIADSPNSTKPAKVPDSSPAGALTGEDICRNPAEDTSHSCSTTNMDLTQKQESNKESNSATDQDDTIIIAEDNCHNITGISDSIISTGTDRLDVSDNVLTNFADYSVKLHSLTRDSTNEDNPQSHTEDSNYSHNITETDKNLTEDLNVTEYVNRILTQNNEDCVDLTDESDNLTNSQESIVISDDELNYSSCYNASFKSQQSEEDLEDFEEDLLDDSLNDALVNVPLSDQIPGDKAEQTTPASLKNCLIKTQNITPMADYDQMNTPKIVDELKKFGLKPLKRRRGVQMLKYIYESTHPIVETDKNDDTDEDEGNRSKRRKISFDELQQVSIVGDIVTERELVNDELIFERNRSKTIASCQVPLQIVWYNFLVNNPEIHKNILLYEPLQLEVVYSMLKQHGFKFHIQDLVMFLDRKCITIRTNQSNNNKH